MGNNYNSFLIIFKISIKEAERLFFFDIIFYLRLWQYEPARLLGQLHLTVEIWKYDVDEHVPLLQVRTRPWQLSWLFDVEQRPQVFLQYVWTFWLELKLALHKPSWNFLKQSGPYAWSSQLL